MAILTVGPTSTFPTIAAAMAVAGSGDIISLEAGYGNENATVTVNDLSFDGGPTSTDINLQLATGIAAITLLGTAPINILDGPDANTVVGNDGDNIISVSSGVDVVTAGNGTDRLIIDYSAATASITGTTVNVTDGGTHAVTFTGVENFTITTGSGNDTITVADGANVLNTGGGDDTITAGNGPNIIDGGANNDTITAGSGVNTIDGGDGNDTIVAGDGGNFVDGGDGDDGISTGIGDDVVIAGLGNDTILTSAGADVTTVNGGIDTVDSGSGSDRLIVDFSSSTTNVNGGVTGGTLAGGYDGAFADVAGTSSVVFQDTENFTVTTGSGNDVIATGDGDDVLDGGAGADQLNGGGGSDTLLIGLGNDALDGGADTDTAIFSAARSNYQVNDLGGGVIQTIDLRSGSPDGTDTLVNMEGFVFTDGTFDATTILNVAPTLGGDLAIAVANGGTVIVTVADLTATDADNTNTQLVYTVTGALHGTILLGGIAASSFTEADILANAVSFQHDGSASDGSFSVSLTDGTAAAQAATVIATAGNAAPSATNDAVGAVAEDSGQRTILGATLTGNDSAGPASESGQTLTVTAVSNVIGGSASVSGGNVLFTPTADFNGAASFDYTVTDDGTTNGIADPLTATATASFTVTEVNDTPSAANDGLSAVAEDSGQRTILGSALTGNDNTGPSSESGQTLTVTAVSNVIGGSASVSGGNVLFTPAANFNGAASFDYTVTDDGTTNGAPAPLTTTATTSFNVTAANDPPTVGGDLGIAVANGGAVIVTAADLTATDADNINSQLVYTVTGTLHGAVLLAGTAAASFTQADILANAVSFQHDGSPTDGGFTVSLTDGAAAPQIATVTATQSQSTFTGTAGDDSFTALPGNERIAFGGIDTVTFGFRLVDATVTYAGNQVIIDSASSHTVLSGFETYVFTDGTVNNNDGNWLIDDLFYNSQYHDVWNAHVDADVHYNLYGWQEGRDPSAFFDTLLYLSLNPDVKASGANPLMQYDQTGWKEGDVPSFAFDGAKYLAANPDVAAANIDPLEHFLANGAEEGRQPFAVTEMLAPNGFDYVYYLQHNPDVAAAGVDPFQHYQTMGWHEGRNPNALFDTAGYLATYADVAAAGVNPLDYYHTSGWNEGRDPSVNFDTASYLAAYPDVAAAHIDPLLHFLANGTHEGRSTFADGQFG